MMTVLWDAYERFSIEVGLEKKGWKIPDAEQEAVRQNNLMLKELQDNLKGLATGPIVCCIWDSCGFDQWKPVGVSVMRGSLGDCFLRPRDYAGKGILYWAFSRASREGDLYVIYAGKDGVTHKVVFRALQPGVTEEQLRKAWSPIQTAFDHSVPMGAWYCDA
jgi:hypothetical protein